MNSGVGHIGVDLSVNTKVLTIPKEISTVAGARIRDIGQLDRVL